MVESVGVNTEVIIAVLAIATNLSPNICARKLVNETINNRESRTLGLITKI